MKDPEVVGILEDALARERSSFVRYIIEVSQPPVVDEADQRSLAFYQDFYRETQRSLDALVELLRREGIVARDPPRWPMRFTKFNYLRPRYLLRVSLTEAERRLAETGELASALERPWPEAFEAMDDLHRRESEHLDRLRKLAEEIPEQSSEPSQLKGTSASRW